MAVTVINGIRVYNDLRGRVFGKLKPLFPLPRPNPNRTPWHCLCDCGNECDVDAGELVTGGTKSCGCLVATEDLTGRVFGRLTVTCLAEGRRDHRRIWQCSCTCGNQITVAGSILLRGSTQSCGCLARELASERATTHAMSTTPTYGSWNSMRDRCNNPELEAYPRYGGRGITVHPEWNDSFEAFHRDMGDRPDGMTLDRKDTDGNYEPGNCRWATPSVQQINRRPGRNSKSGIVGVRQTTSGRWHASLTFKGKVILDETFDTMEMAVGAREAAERYVDQLLHDDVVEALIKQDGR